MFFRTGAGAEGFLELAQALSFQVFRFEKRLPLSCAPRKGQRSAGPLPGAARHFAFSETGRAGHTQCVCCFAPEIRCAHFGAALANPAPSVPLKTQIPTPTTGEFVFFSRAEPPGVLCYFLSFKKAGDMYQEKKPETSAHNPNPQKETLNIQRLRQSHKKGTLKTQHTR